MAKRATISSNATEFFAALQTDPRLIPVDADWFEKEPNSYDSFGEEQSKTARAPINAGRMKKKPTLIGFDASTGFNQDLTAENSIMEVESFLFANRRDKGDVTSTTIVADGYTVASGGGVFKAGNLVVAEPVSDIVNSGNLGVKVLAADGVSAKVLAPGLTAESGGKVRLRKCGHQFAAGKASINATNGALPKLATDTFDATTLGLLPGETVYLNADDDANRFANEANRGWCRVFKVDATGITFDKTDVRFVTDAGTGKTIRLYFGVGVKNEKDPALQETFYWAFRRRLGIADDGGAVVQSEVTYGNVANEMTFNVDEEDKITIDVAYIAKGYLPFEDDGDVDEDGTLVRVVEANAINSAKDSRRLRVGIYPKVGDTITGVPTLLFPAFNEFNMNINNNIQTNKAITYAGAYALTPGFFEFMLSLTGYFVEVAGITAIHEDSDLTFDFAVFKENKGIAWDAPLVGGSTEGLDVEANQAIMIDVDCEAAEGSKYNKAFDHALFVVFFPYLPTVAAD